jgi:hypothetical protein
MPTILDRLSRCTGFDWDAGNARKNWEAHGVTSSESEQVFLNRPLVAVPDDQHSRNEPRLHALGRTNTGRQLALVFTIRGDLVRVISARDMSRRERRVYERSQGREEEG